MKYCNSNGYFWIYSNLCENTEASLHFELMVTGLWPFHFVIKILFGIAKLTGMFLHPGNEDGKVTAVMMVCDVHQCCTVKEGPTLTLSLPSSVPPGILRLV